MRAVVLGQGLVEHDWGCGHRTVLDTDDLARLAGRRVFCCDGCGRVQAVGRLAGLAEHNGLLDASRPLCLDCAAGL